MASIRRSSVLEGVTYVPGFLTGPEQSVLVHRIRNLSFANDRHRGIELKRSSIQFGYAYAATGQKILPAPPCPAFLTELIVKAVGSPESERFEQCMVTHYPAGAGIGWHIDSEGFGDCIVVVSIVGDARLQFCPSGAKQPTHEVSIAPGSLYFLRGNARENYQHRVVAVKQDRYSIIFRSIRNPQHSTT